RGPSRGPGGCRAGPGASGFTCCCCKFCFLGLPFQSWAAQELALFKACGENWGEEGEICFFL
uniref:Uncharacterized protein n=1 Tax=Ursus maritimus TaxID=29073 RepID=A0A452UE69_URSMA